MLVRIPFRKIPAMTGNLAFLTRRLPCPADDPPVVYQKAVDIHVTGRGEQGDQFPLNPIPRFFV